MRRRGLKLAALALAALLVLVAVPAAVVLCPTFKAYPAGDATDLAHLRRLPEVERSFTDQTRAAFLRAVDAIDAQADRAGLAMAAARAVALADNGHTNVLGLVGDYGFNAVPIRLAWFEDGLFVVAAIDESLLGAQLLALNGGAPAGLVDALRRYVGGPANLAREFVPNFLISPELLHAAGLGEAADAGTYDLRLRDGREVSVVLGAHPATQAPLRAFSWPKRDLSLLGRAGSWRHVLGDVALPAYLSRPDTYYWHDYPQPDLLYVQINRMNDQGPKGLSQYLADMVDEAAARGIRHAVVDLRFNGGGNYVLAAEFARRLPALLPPDGRLFILTSTNTFSAAISTAARLKHFAGSRAVIVGEAMGDRGQFWGEGGRTVLPASGIAIRYAIAMHDWQRGCGLADVTTCFFLNYVYGVPAGNLAPAVAVAPRFADYAAGRDVAMVRVLGLLGGE